MFTDEQKKELIKRGVDPKKIDTIKKSELLKIPDLFGDMFGESVAYVGGENMIEKNRQHYEYTQFLDKLCDAICDMEDDEGMDELFKDD